MQYKDSRNQQGGFIQLIIAIIILLFIMKYTGVTLSDIVNWFANTFHTVLR